jgi:hypothetical protein
VADCAAREQVKMSKVVGALVKEVGTGAGSEESGKIKAVKE